MTFHSQVDSKAIFEILIHYSLPRITTTNSKEENGIEELLEDVSLRKDCTAHTACKKEATYDTICVVLGRRFGQESEVVVAIQRVG